MTDSPIAAIVRAIDALDVDAIVALFAPDGRILTVDGREADGSGQVRALIGEFVGELRATSHTITSEWHPEPNVWIAEIEATYDLTDYTRLGPYARAIILRDGSTGVRDVRMYGLHELPLAATTRSYQEVFGSGHWLPTL